MKFDMGNQTLTTLTRQSQGASTDLGSLIRQLLVAAEPLEGKFSGAGKTTYDGFKGRSDEIINSLNGALSAILGGQSGMDAAFMGGEQESAENANQAMGQANFDGARFGAR